MENTDSTLTLRDYPIGLWFFGLIGLAFGGFIFYKDPDQWMAVVLGAGFCLLILVLSSVLVIKADRNTSTLTLTYISLFRRKVKEIPLRDITSIRIETSRSHSSRGSSSPTYRIVAALADGQVVPFRSYSSSGRGGKAGTAKKLCAYLGIQCGGDGSMLGSLNQVTQLVQGEMQRQMDSSAEAGAEEQVTDGVHWRVQELKWGKSGVTRWFSPDFQTPGGFVFLAQKPEGQNFLSGALFTNLGKALGPQVLQIYGFTTEDTPGFDSAETLTSLDPRIEPHFSGMSSDRGIAQRVLNTYTSDALADWARRYPVKQFQQAPIFQQLAVMFSPRGVFVAAFGHMIPEAIDELRNLGVALVKAQ